MREKLLLEEILMDTSPIRWPRQSTSAPANSRILDDNDGALPRRVAVAKGAVTRLVPVDSILWITTSDGSVRLHMKDGELETDDSLGALTVALGGQFMRINRKTTVNLAAVMEIRRRTRHGECVVVIANGSELSATRLYAPLLKQWLSGGEARPSRRTTARVP
jgi:DNA-binding LytR/AlgR family response regulator